MLVECLCAQKGFVHTSLSLAEDDGGAGRRMVSVVQVCSCAVLTLSMLTDLRVRGRCVCRGLS